MMGIILRLSRSKVIHPRWLPSIAGCIPRDIFFTPFLPSLWLRVLITWKILYVLL